MNNIKPLKLAFIGGGINSAIGYTHKIASQMDNKFELVAGAFSRDSEINNQTALKWNINLEHLYDDWQDLLRQEVKNIDAIVILTPTPTHFKIIEKAISYGYNIISEKAMVKSLKEAHDIDLLVKKHNIFLSVIYNYTGYTMLRELKYMILNNKLGKINQIHIEMPQEGYLKLNDKKQPVTPQNWRLKDEFISTISLDLGVHLENIIKFLTNENPVKLVAIKDSFGYFENIADDVMCIVKYTNNISCNIWYSKSALGNSNGLKINIYGSRASAEWEQSKSEYLVLNNQYGEKKIISRASNCIEEAKKVRYNRFKPGHPSGFIEAFANYYYDIAEALNEFLETGSFVYEKIFNSKDAKNGLRLFDKIELSSKNEEWVFFDKEDE